MNSWNPDVFRRLSRAQAFGHVFSSLSPGWEEGVKELGVWWPREFHIMKPTLAKVVLVPVNKKKTSRQHSEHHTQTAVYDMEPTFLEGKD